MTHEGCDPKILAMKEQFFCMIYQVSSLNNNPYYTEHEIDMIFKPTTTDSNIYARLYKLLPLQQAYTPISYLISTFELSCLDHSNMSHLTKIVAAFVMIVLVSESAMGAPDCMPILRTLDPCIPYLVQNPGRADTPSKACCDGLTTLSTLPNIKDECECIKASVLLMPFDLPRFAALPSDCGASLQIPTISGDMDCSK